MLDIIASGIWMNRQEAVHSRMWSCFYENVFLFFFTAAIYELTVINDNKLCVCSIDDLALLR